MEVGVAAWNSWRRACGSHARRRNLGGNVWAGDRPSNSIAATQGREERFWMEA